MIRKPEKILVFSSESDDAIGLQIYRLLYPDTSFDLMFVEGEYRNTKEIDNYILPSEDGEDVYVNADQLVELFGEVEDTVVINYDTMGMFYDYNLGFEFDDDMIDEISSQIEPEELAPEVRELLKDFSFVSQQWDLLDWEASEDVLIENLDYVLRSDEDLDKIEAVISESSEFKNMVYPELFELLLYAADLYEEKYFFARTKTKVFCLKTTAESEYPNFIYDIDGIDITEDEDTKIVDLVVMQLNEWFDAFSLYPEDIEDAEDIGVDLEELRRDEKIKKIEDEMLLGYDEDLDKEEFDNREVIEEVEEEELDELDAVLEESEEQSDEQAEEDSLTEIKGVGGSTADNLKSEGYTTVQSIAEATVEELSALKGIGKNTAQKYIDNAKQLI